MGPWKGGARSREVNFFEGEVEVTFFQSARSPKFCPKSARSILLRGRGHSVIICEATHVTLLNQRGLTDEFKISQITVFTIVNQLTLDGRQMCADTLFLISVQSSNHKLRKFHVNFPTSLIKTDVSTKHLPNLLVIPRNLQLFLAIPGEG